MDVSHESTRVDVTRPGIALPGNLRRLSEVPQFIVQPGIHLARRGPAAAAQAQAPSADLNVRNVVGARREDVDEESACGGTTLAMAPPRTASTPPAGPLALPPSTANASHPDAVDASYGATELACKGTARIALNAAELNLVSSSSGGRVAKPPGTAGGHGNESDEHMPGEQMSAVEEEVKRRSLAAEQARRRLSEGGLPSSPPRNVAASEPDSGAGAELSLGTASPPWRQEQEQLAWEDGAVRHGGRHDGEKRLREEHAESHGRKKPRIGPLGGGEGKGEEAPQPAPQPESQRRAPAPQPPRRREDAETRASAEEHALRKRQAQAAAAQAERERRLADSAQLQSSFQVHVCIPNTHGSDPADWQGRSVPRTYVTLREAASRGSANVTAVIIDIKSGIRTTSTGTASAADLRH